MNLKGQVAIITGASSGIGGAVAKNLDAAGMKLVLTARRVERLGRLASELDKSISVAADMTEPDLPQRLIEMALDRFGRCDVVINNAGIWEGGTIEEINIERLCQMVRINVEASFRMAYTAIKYFRSVNRGYLMNTSSVAGTKLIKMTSGAYAGTKHAIEALSEGLRMELAGTNIKVSCIEPGFVATELQEHLGVDLKELYKIQQPLEPEDIADLVRFLLEQPDHILIPRVMILPKEQQV
jgi:NADP-dependent 3-hydroxy acid dehydrogenase YdfG